MAPFGGPRWFLQRENGGLSELGVCIASPRSKTPPNTAPMAAFCWLLYTRSAILYAGTGNRARVLQEGGESRDKSRRPRCFCARPGLVNTGQEGGVRNRAEMRPSELWVAIGGHILLFIVRRHE